MSYNIIELDVIRWAEDRQILKHGNVKTQLLKTMSELGELADAVIKNDRSEIVDGLGDVLVTLIVVATMLDLDLTNCLERAYDEIKDRKGYLNENGVFVKES
jgi:NTP pyrophosphatase (non-canonical NTP hydrolase)